MGYIGIIVLLVVVINLLTAAKKKSQKNQANQPGAPVPQAPVRPVPQPPYYHPRVNAGPATYAPKAQPAPAPKPAPAPAPEQAPRFGTGSAGKPVSVPEGMSTMQPRIASRLEEELQPTQGSAPHLNGQASAYAGSARRNGLHTSAARELRRAMVLKEVLDRPISMRRGQRL